MNASIQFACRNGTRRISMQSARFRVILTLAFCQILPQLYVHGIRILNRTSVFCISLIVDKSENYLISELFKILLKKPLEICILHIFLALLSFLHR